ncbi:translation initiation factor IF-2 [Pseudenhygromyxa sp. WMMC2535]|uniref:translation initiation factor IF-2 n=1 Tax=Pseudenhygromyxa sp. WMMC2535 TaxID=2712867 RepID=UPI0015557FB7|nr:translation initiation factor IF-2 [Pseudenhygromyxa sp. WMMC2535]NVB41570.1 translation initiation factor IF-2 [Pseudenhygromyxa sp. WMMC2535]
MAKIRIYELARELGIENNKDLVAEVRGLGIECKSVMSTLTDEQADRVRRHHGQSGGGSNSAGSANSASSGGGGGGEAPGKRRGPKVIRRKAAGPRPAVKEREKEREREEAQRAAEPAPAPTPASTPVIRRTRRADEAEAAQGESSQGERRDPAARDAGTQPMTQREDADTAASEEEPVEEKRAVPQVGQRIALPPGTRRFRDGLAAKIEAREEAEEQRRRVEEEAARHRAREEAEAKKRADAEAKKREAAATRDDGRSGAVVRNEDGVIVAAAPKRSEPKILGFIPLQNTSRRREVIITEANKGRTAGRATARKMREERAQARGRRSRARPRRDRGGVKQVSTVEMSEAKKRIRVDEVIQLSDMAHQMGAKASRLVRTLWGMGMRNVTINSAIDVEMAELVAAEFGYTIENVSFQEDDLLADYGEGEGELRAPVVTIMGHVDHGKTTLLDYVRDASVASGEAGGITQHIGAYRVETDQGPVVFIDTPGHEAFTAMRERGAAVTDIIVLIVAADDGVMPTTQEAIKHANEAGVPIIVAINKIDKPEANVGRVEQMLMKEGLVGENYGGETAICHISAKKGDGVEALLELLAVQAEVLELRAPYDGAAAGTVIESRVDKGRGTVATVLVQAGKLKKGDIVVANECSGKVRSLFTPTGKKVKSATPSTPVEILGLDGAPPAGERFHVVESERDARQLVAHRREVRRRKESVLSGPSLLERIKSKKVPALKIVLKADVQGSAEALKETLETLSVDKVRVEVIHAGVGAINETDVKLAIAADNPLIIGFNVKTVGKAAPLAEHEKIPIETFSVIYEATDRIRERMIDLLEPEYREVELGEAEVRALFPIPRLGVVAGCRVIKGKVTRNSHVRVRREKKIIHVGKIGSLRVFKDDVREVKEGQECGIVVDDFGDVQPEDVLEAFELETIRPEL